MECWRQKVQEQREMGVNDPEPSGYLQVTSQSPSLSEAYISVNMSSAQPSSKWEAPHDSSWVLDPS